MKLLGFVLLGATCLLVFLKYENVSLWSAGIGIALAAGLFLLLLKSEAPVVEQANPLQSHFDELKTQSTQTIESLNREVQKMQQRLVRADERCLSYQKLVDVHQTEIDKLKLESGQLGQHLIEKDRKIAELQLARIEPDLFDAEKRQTESSYRELKKQFDEKSQALDQARIRLFHVESELLAFQKEREEQTRILNPAEATLIQQLQQTEEEKKKLETELVSLQQIVSELSLLKNSKNSRKKTASSPEGNADLLGL
jgi:chromosome segregation ATPase